MSLQNQHGQAEQRMFLRVFIQVSDPIEDKSDDLNSSSNLCTQSQYCTISITATSLASDICNAVARKRNLLYIEDEYELVICDGDGETSYEKILGPHDAPHTFQQSAAKHGHLGNFHFVFRKSNHEIDLYEDTDSDSESKPDIFNSISQTQQDGKYPAGWMEKRDKTHKSWRRRYFVLINHELLYFKRRDVYEDKREPVETLDVVNPPAIIKILPHETQTTTCIDGQTHTLFLFHIDTSKKIYTLRVNNSADMMYWVNALQLLIRNEANELMDALDCLICESQVLHSNQAETIMHMFSTLNAILSNKDATDAYMKYLQSIHNEEFILFLVDFNQYVKHFDRYSKDKQKRFALELYDKYIKSKARFQLSEIKSKHRSNVKHQIENNLVTKDMFNDIKLNVFNYLNRDSHKFFNSNDYFRFIMTYNNDNVLWPEKFGEKMEKINI